MDIGLFHYYLIKKNIMSFLKNNFVKMVEIFFMPAGDSLIKKNFIKN